MQISEKANVNTCTGHLCLKIVLLTLSPPPPIKMQMSSSLFTRWWCKESDWTIESNWATRKEASTGPEWDEAPTDSGCSGYTHFPTYSNHKGKKLGRNISHSAALFAIHDHTFSCNYFVIVFGFPSQFRILSDLFRLSSSIFRAFPVLRDTYRSRALEDSLIESYPIGSGLLQWPPGGFTIPWRWHDYGLFKLRGEFLKQARTIRNDCQNEATVQTPTESWKNLTTSQMNLATPKWINQVQLSCN